MTTREKLIWAVPLLLLLFGTRLFVLRAVPPFIDEAYFLTVAERIPTESLLYRSEEGRVMAGWYWLLLQAPFGGDPVWVARYADLLLVVLSLAAMIAAVAREGRLAGIALVGSLYIFSSYHTFYGVLGVTDVMSASLLMVAAWLVYRLKFAVRYREAVLVGILLLLVYGTKISGLPYVLIVPLGALLLRPWGDWRAVWGWAGVALGTFGVLFALLTGVQQWRGYRPLHLILVNTSAPAEAVAPWVMIQGLVLQILARLQAIVTDAAHYVGVIGVVVIGGALLVALWQRRWFFVAVIAIPGASILPVSVYYTRYLYGHLLLAFVIVALVLGPVAVRRRAAAVGIFGALVVWAGVYWLPTYTALLAGDVPPLTERDIREHYALDGSGYRVADVAALLVTLPPADVVGLFPNCDALRLQTKGDLAVMCPRINPDGSDRERLAVLLADELPTGSYIVRENSPYVPDTVPGEQLAVFERVGGVTWLEVWRLE